MVELALNIQNQRAEQRFQPYLVYSSVYSKDIIKKTSNGIVILAAILIALQVLDGILTGFGMSLFGTAAEGNSLLRSLMDVIGYVPALIIAKSAAIAVICFICKVAKSYSWIKYALAGSVLIYVFAAIIPWFVILSNAQIY